MLISKYGISQTMEYCMFQLLGSHHTSDVLWRHCVVIFFASRLLRHWFWILAMATSLCVCVAIQLINYSYFCLTVDMPAFLRYFDDLQAATSHYGLYFFYYTSYQLAVNAKFNELLMYCWITCHVFAKSVTMLVVESKMGAVILWALSEKSVDNISAIWLVTQWM